MISLLVLCQRKFSKLFIKNKAYYFETQISMRGLNIPREVFSMSESYINNKNAEFKKNASNLISLTLNGKTYDRVYLFRAFPIFDKDDYIVVKIKSDSDMVEIGIIKSLNDFDSDTKDILSSELKLRYFIPTIIKVNSIKNEFQTYLWNVESNAGHKSFEVPKDNRSLRVLDEYNQILITDSCSNKFIIEDYKKLDTRSYRIISSVI